MMGTGHNFICLLQVRPSYDKFRTVHFLSLPEAMNRCWAESDETAMLSVHRRNREVNESKIKFQVSFIQFPIGTQHKLINEFYSGIIHLSNGLQKQSVESSRTIAIQTLKP